MKPICIYTYLKIGAFLLIAWVVSPRLMASDTPTAIGSSSAVGSNPTWLSFMPESKLPVNFDLSITQIYDDNIYLQPTKTHDFINQVAPSVSFVMGHPELHDENYINFFYQPTFLTYFDNSNQDSIEHHVDLQYSHTFTKLRLGLEQEFSRISDATTDSNNIVRRDVFSTKAKADYDYSERLSFYNTFEETYTDYAHESLVDTNEATLNSYFLFKVTPRLRLGAGVLIGYLDQQFAPNQTYQQFLAHAEYKLSGKTTITLATGVEEREYNYGPTNQLNPVFDLGVQYQATPSTSFSLVGHAQTYAATSLHGENYRDISVKWGVQQRFFRKYFLNLDAGYDNDSYKQIDPAVMDIVRVDNYFFVRSGLSWVPNNRVNFSVSYQYSKDNSTYNFADFNNNQYSFRCEIKY